MKYKLKVLTPTFIGSDEKYLKFFNFVYINGNIYIYNFDDLINTFENENSIKNFLRDIERWYNIIRRNRSQRNEANNLEENLSQNILHRLENNELKYVLYDDLGYIFKEIDKPIFSVGNPIIPGSSIKGFIRSVIIYQRLRERINDINTKLENLRNDANLRWYEKLNGFFNFVQELVNNIENEIKDKIHSIQVSDVILSCDLLELYKLSFHNMRNFPVYIEAIKKFEENGNNYYLTLKLDTNNLIDIDTINRFTRQIYTLEQNFAETNGINLNQIENFNSNTPNTQEIYLRIGKYTGLLSHTIWIALFENKNRELEYTDINTYLSEKLNITINNNDKNIKNFFDIRGNIYTIFPKSRRTVDGDLLGFIKLIPVQ